MSRHKKMREKGKFSFTRFFQKFVPGDRVAVIRELSIPFGYPAKLQGRTGIIVEKRGAAYEIEIKDLNKPKRYLIRPVHLKKIEVTA